jgi:hypothetical protein
MWWASEWCSALHSVAFALAMTSALISIATRYGYLRIKILGERNKPPGFLARNAVLEVRARLSTLLLLVVVGDESVVDVSFDLLPVRSFDHVR